MSLRELALHIKITGVGVAASRHQVALLYYIQKLSGIELLSVLQ